MSLLYFLVLWYLFAHQRLKEKVYTGTKYIVDTFNYPHHGVEIKKQCHTIVGCLFWLIVLSIQYDGVNVQKRSLSSIPN